MPRYMLEFKTPLNTSARGQFHHVTVPDSGDAEAFIQEEIDRLVTQHGLVGSSDELLPEVIVEAYALERAAYRFVTPADALDQPPMLPTDAELCVVLPATSIAREGRTLRFVIDSGHDQEYFLLERRVRPGDPYVFTLCETDVFGEPTSIHSAHSDWKALCVGGVAEVIRTERSRSTMHADHAAALEKLLADHAKSAGKSGK